VRGQKLSTLLSSLLSLLLAWPAAARPAAAQAAGQPPTKQQAQTEKIKRRVNDWGVLTQVSVTLKSGEKLKGRVSEINDESFTLRLENSAQNATRDVRYDEVKSVSAKRGGAGPVVSRIVFGPAGVGGAILLGVLVAVAAAGLK
jgi:transcriptional antiterminator Rof (Rho-off)